MVKLGACWSFLGSALLFTAVLNLVSPSDAVARVGVTAATDGDPLGRPPGESERVLRVGIDVQANEIISTKENDRAHLLFLDGTSLTVGPNAQLVIDKFVFDPNTNSGDLAITVSKGAFRIVGGKISKDKPITVNSPTASMGIRGGIVAAETTSTGTTWYFLFGRDMVVCSANPIPTGPAGSTSSTGILRGQANGAGCQTVTQPGFQVTSASSGLGVPTMTGQIGLAQLLSALEGNGRGTGNTALLNAIAAANLNTASLLSNLLALVPQPTATSFSNVPLGNTVNQSQVTNGSPN
jgi:hypothetical protein